jgi:hypothetical protein
MTDNAKKTSELATTNNAVATDRIVILKDPTGTPSTRTISVSNLLGNSAANVVIQQLTPANSTVLTVKAGTLFFDNTYLYVATSNNNVKRVALSTF